MVVNLLLNPFKFGNKRKEDRHSAAIYPAGTFWGGGFDGEQEPGAFNFSAYVYDVDYYELAKRAYTLVTINEYAGILAGRLTQFVVGTGLRLHPQPMRRLLKRIFKVVLPEDFAKAVAKSLNETTIPYLENILYSLNKLNENAANNSGGDIVDKLF